MTRKASSASWNLPAVTCAYAALTFSTRPGSVVQRRGPPPPRSSGASSEGAEGTPGATPWLDDASAKK